MYCLTGHEVVFCDCFYPFTVTVREQFTIVWKVFVVLKNGTPRDEFATVTVSQQCCGVSSSVRGLYSQHKGLPWSWCEQPVLCSMIISQGTAPWEKRRSSAACWGSSHCRCIMRGRPLTWSPAWSTVAPAPFSSGPCWRRSLPCPTVLSMLSSHTLSGESVNCC